MAKFTVGEGIDNYARYWENWGGLPYDEDLEFAIQKGADVMMKAVRERAESIPVHDADDYGAADRRLSGVTQRQKTGILNSLGVAPMRRDKDFINVKIGVDGYNSVKTKKYTKGQPNAMIVRALESGTSFRKPYRFVTAAVRRARKDTEKAMADAYDEAIKRRFKEAVNNG